MMEEIKKIVDSIKTYPEVVAIILYGSHAKNKANPLSDIDIAVIVKDEKIEAEIGSFSSNKFDVVPFHRLPLYIQFEVLKDGKILFLRDRNYFNRIKRRVIRNYLEMSEMYRRFERRVMSR